MVAVLTIAGIDPTGRAGVAADLRAFCALGVHGALAVTALTAQDDGGVSALSVTDPDLVAGQIAAAAATVAVKAVKTGMLGDARVVAAVGAALAGGRLGPVVVDPVLGASSGGVLLEAAAWPVLVSELLPLATVATPNLPEASLLLGRPVEGRREMPDAAAALAGMGSPAVLLKGGHLQGPDCPDLLWDRGRLTWLEGPRLASRGARGTGCTLSAAIAARLALGDPLPAACRAAKAFVAERITARPAGV